MNIHVIPLDDERLHCAQDTCSCAPLFEQLCAHGLYLHHAWDLREKYERLGLLSDGAWVVIGEET